MLIKNGLDLKKLTPRPQGDTPISTCSAQALVKGEKKAGFHIVTTALESVILSFGSKYRRIKPSESTLKSVIVY